MNWGITYADEQCDQPLSKLLIRSMHFFSFTFICSLILVFFLLVSRTTICLILATNSALECADTSLVVAAMTDLVNIRILKVLTLTIFSSRSCEVVGLEHRNAVAAGHALCVIYNVGQRKHGVRSRFAGCLTEATRLRVFACVPCVCNYQNRGSILSLRLYFEAFLAGC